MFYSIFLCATLNLEPYRQVLKQLKEIQKGKKSNGTSEIDKECGRGSRNKSANKRYADSAEAIDPPSSKRGRSLKSTTNQITTQLTSRKAAKKSLPDQPSTSSSSITIPENSNEGFFIGCNCN